MTARSCEEACAGHRWEVPERYNIAADVCDRHPREQLAMIHEHHAGAVREVSWGELQDLANQAAHVLASLGVERGDRVAVVLPPTPETAALFFATWKLGAPLPARPSGVRVLPRPAAWRALPWDGGVGLGRRHLPAARPVAPRRSAVR